MGDNPGMSESTLIDKLDDKCLIQIFLNLPIKERLEMEEVCVRWQNVSKKAWYNIQKLEIHEGFERTDGLIPSDDIIEKLLVRCGVYLKTLLFYDACSSHMLEVIAKYCRNLTRISLQFDDFRIEDAKALSKFKKLQSFMIFRTEEKFLIKCLMSLPKTVKSIEFYPKVGTRNLSKVLERFDALDYLGMSGETLGMDLIEGVSNMQTITNLTLHLCVIKEGLNLLSNMRNLEDLNISLVETVDDIFLNCLSTKCKKLTFLDVSGCEQLSDRGIRELKNLDSLENLTISYMSSKVTDSSLGELRGIKTLFCEGCKGVRDEGIIQLIRNCPDLGRLNVRDTSISKKTLQLAISITKERKNSVILELMADFKRLKFDRKKENHSPFLSFTRGY